MLTAPDKLAYVRADAKAWVAGGGGNDSITVGNGTDIVAGDSSLCGGPTVTLTDLKELDLTGTVVSKDGVAALQTALPKCKISRR